jgi:hypothetical protein
VLDLDIGADVEVLSIVGRLCAEKALLNAEWSFLIANEKNDKDWVRLAIMD